MRIILIPNYHRCMYQPYKFSKCEILSPSISHCGAVTIIEPRNCICSATVNCEQVVFPGHNNTLDWGNT